MRTEELNFEHQLAGQHEDAWALILGEEEEPIEAEATCVWEFKEEERCYK